MPHHDYIGVTQLKGSDKKNYGNILDAAKRLQPSSNELFSPVYPTEGCGSGNAAPAVDQPDRGRGSDRSLMRLFLYSPSVPWLALVSAKPEEPRKPARRRRR